MDYYHGSYFNQLYGVSCVNSRFCVAVGKHFNALAYPGVLLETWNGTSWTQDAALVKSTANTGSSLYGVSCLTAAFCVATGIGGQGTLVEQWNGTTWTRVPSPSPYTEDNWLYAVSCISETSCAAVGDGTSSATASWPTALAESFNGSEWVVTQASAIGFGDYLSGVSCRSTGCVAVGEEETSAPDFYKTTLIEQEDGASWNVVPSPSTLPLSKNASGLSAVSCTNVRCVAVGWTHPLSQEGSPPSPNPHPYHVLIETDG